MFYVYKMIHTPTGRVYIGQRKLPKGKTPETDGYYGSGKVWKSIYKAHPEECVKVILDVVKTKKEVDELEKEYITHYRSVYGGLCVNIADGGDGFCGKGEKNPFFGKHHTEESRRKNAEAHKGEKNHFFGKHLSAETRKKMSLAQKGKHPSEETRKKLSESHKGKHHTEESRRKISEAFKGEKHPNYGKHPSEETRRKMSEAHKALKGEKAAMFGKHHSEETRRKISESLKNRKENN